MKVLVTLVFICCAPLLVAQPTGNHHLATDTEVGSDGSVTQYVLYDYQREGKTVGLSALVLGLRADDGSQFLELGGGPDFHGKGWFLNTYFGGAKGGRLIAATLGGIDLPHKFKFVAASDPKFPVGNLGGAPEIWFSRVWVGRDDVFRKFGLYFRHDNLQEAGHGNISSKTGVEIRRPIKSRTEVYSFGYYDYQTHNGGITGGVRVKFR